ncbi:MAG: thiamine phosphate synthase [Coprococcus sp.]
MYNEYKDTIVITNRKLVKGDFLEQLQKVCRLHPYALILREKDMDDSDYEKLAKDVINLCEKERVLCFLHSKIDIARKLQCQNIHLPIWALEQAQCFHKESMSMDFAKISVSCHSIEDVCSAVEFGATQIVLGTIFETDCKRGLRGRGTDFVREVCDVCPIPVYAIGGISLENLSRVKMAGAAGGCMMSGFMKL